MLPEFVPAGRRRPVDLVAPGTTLDPATAPARAASVAVECQVDGRFGEISLRGACSRFTVRNDERGVHLEVEAGGVTTGHRSRRSAHPDHPPDALGLTLTGRQVTALSRSGTSWTARARMMDLEDRLDPRDPHWLSTLRAAGSGDIRAGRYGQLGLRDLRLVTNSDASPYLEAGADPNTVWLSATSAGPGPFATAHCSIWRLDTWTLDLTHSADLFFTRPGRPGVFTDHAAHAVRDGNDWLVATSTWDGFEPTGRRAHVGTTLARVKARSTDVLRGVHVLETEPLRLPTDGLRSVGTWDPHLVHTGEEWLVGFVSARKFFDFHPVLAAGPTPGDLTLRAAATSRRATEGSTLHRMAAGWRLLASDGRDGRRGQRERYPIFDTSLREVGAIDAPYPTNLPWPTLVPTPEGWLMVGFNGRPHGGRVLGYGSHGDVVFARSK